jgi:anti-sigma factor RsiW
MAEQPGSGRLDSEILAAYVDGRLPPEDRARVEAEIAADPETQEWLVNTIRAVDEAAAEPEMDEELELVLASPHRSVDSARMPRSEGSAVLARRSSLPRRRRLLLGGAGVVLATAAALLLAVRVQPAWWQQLWGPAVDPRFAKLVAAVGEERYIEGRLSGGFKYGPLRSVTRGPGDLSNQNLALLAAAGELQRAAQADPSAENLHAW